VTEVLVLAYVVAVIIIAVTFMRIPRWCFLSLQRYRVWELRDEVADALLQEALPHKAQPLLKAIDCGIQSLSQITVARVGLAYLTMKNRTDDLELDEIEQTLDVMQAEAFRSYRERYEAILLSTLLSTSWLGLALGALTPVVWAVAGRGGKPSQQVQAFAAAGPRLVPVHDRGLGHLVA
jgi:hypothetical protein